LFDESELQWMVKNRMLEKADVRLPPQNETVPRPEPDECVVFRDHFTAGFCMPCQDFIEEILKAYNIEMHHLTSNGMAKIALFIWAVKSQSGNLDIGVFFVLFMRCILNFGVKWLMKKVSSNILDAVVLSKLAVLNR
jgi:hypothetical protein